jgi:ABC-type transport system involved in multi-copper enzyme maturation permease subunit
MTTTTITPYRCQAQGARDGFAQLLHAEWTKFRTVRGWIIAMVAVAVVTVGIGQLNHSNCGTSITPQGNTKTGCSAPTGPDGEAVTDSFYFVHQPLAADSSITARLASLTGSSPDGGGQTSLTPWSKAGILIKANTRPGSAYAAIMVTAGHGVRMQYNFTGDIPGPTGIVSDAAPRWLRLTRSGNVLTGYWSADGQQWNQVGRVRITGLPATAQGGLFTAAPGTSQSGSQSLGGSTGSGGMALASARFDHISLQAPQPGSTWTGNNIGAGAQKNPPPELGFSQANGALTVTGTGDIAPDVPDITGAGGAGGIPIERTLLGAFVGLIVVIVVAAMFMTGEYRRGLIRVTLSASPRRGRALAAKAAVAACVAFVAGLAGAATAVPLGERLMRANGNYILPVSALTELRVVAGTAALLAVAAILALALGALLKSSATAVAAAIAAIVLPYLLATTVLPAGVADWVLRLTPAAGFAIQQSIPHYPQVAVDYTPINGYYPLAPWAGFAVLCGYAALALGLAVIQLRRSDA